MRLSSYDKSTGEFYEFSSEGIILASGFATEADIIAAVINEHYKNNLPDISNGFNKSATYLQDETWLVVIDDASVNYIQDAYQYLYHANGNVDYLGYFVESSLYIGLSKDTFVTYSPMRGIDLETGEYTNPHYFRQFSHQNGELLSEKVISHDDLPPVLYSQKHSTKGIVSTSDSYSTVVLLNNS